MSSFYWVLTLCGQALLTPFLVIWARKKAGLSRGYTAALSVVLAVWYIAAVTLSATWFFRASPDRLPTIAMAIFGPLLVGTLVLYSLGARVPEKALVTLIAFQMVRIMGFEFVLVYLGGKLPGQFSLPAGIGDAFIGVTAPLVALAVARKIEGWRKLAVLWNFLGLLDLAIAVTMGVLTAPSPLQAVAGTVAGTGVDSFFISVLPLSLIPTFGVPLAAIGHLLCLDGLRHARSPQRVLRPVTQS